MEEKLAAYRARKAKEQATEQSLVNRLRKSILKKSEGTAETGKKEKDEHYKEISDPPCKQENGKSEDCPNQSRSMYWTLLILKFILWLCIWGIFIELQFGAVFFTLSLIIFIYFNTRAGQRDSKLSAYSVFNKDCERIQGTLTAEQMQREMFRVPGLPS